MPTKKEAQAKPVEEDAAIETYYYSGSGPGLDACCYLGQRYDAERGFKPHESECWVLSNFADGKGRYTMGRHYGTTGWLTRLWRSPLGTVFVSSMTDSKVLIKEDLRLGTSTQWVEAKMGAPINGVWGLDDRFVLAWGATFDGKKLISRYDGKSWNQMPAPDFEVRDVHGRAPDFLYAVGVGGGVAKWDGSSWKRFPAPTDEVLNCVFVAGDDEIYATGGGGILLEGSASGWGKIGECPRKGLPLLAVAKWKNELWVAGGQLGLFKRKGKSNELECVKPNLTANGFDARENLLISCGDRISNTADGKSFFSSGQGFLAQLRTGKALGDID